MIDTIKDPITLFSNWYNRAKKLEPNNPNAMCLTTITQDNWPNARMVLLKDFDARGFTYYTNTTSQKGADLKNKQKAALCFYWKSMQRQIRIQGSVARVSEKEADAYFATRYRGSQIGAWASLQSQELSSMETLKSRTQEFEEKFEGQDVPRPPHWSGYRVVPKSIEFWEDRPFRLHERLVFTKQGNGWTTKRLYP